MAAKAPVPTVALDRRWFWAAGLFLGFCALFGFSHDRIYYFDGLLQGGIIKNPLQVYSIQVALEWNHFLWYPFGRLFFVLTHWAGYGGGGYETLQCLNTLVGAAGAALLFMTMSRFATKGWSALWTVAACLGEVYWYRSAGAENHLTGAVWCLVQAAFMASYWRRPGWAPMFGMAVSGLLAAYFHLGNFAAWGVAGVAVLWRAPKDIRLTHFTALVLLVVVGWIPYALVHGWLDPGGFVRWWSWATSLAHGFSPGSGHKGVDWNVLNKGLVMLKTLVKCILFYETWGWGTALRLAAVAAGCAVAAFYRTPRPRWDHPSLPFLIPFGMFLGLYTFWMPGNYMYWVVQWPVLCLFLATVSPSPRPAVSWAGLCVVVLVLGYNNLTTVILPHKTNPDAYLVEMCRDFGRLTPPQSPIVISGRGEPQLKPYIPYFSLRDRLAVELFALNAVDKNMDAVQWMRGALVQYIQAGVPVYITGDALRCAGDFADFGLSREAVESVWGGLAPLPIKEYEGKRPNSLSLLWGPSIPDQIQDVIYLRLKTAGLRDQAEMLLKARLRTRPSAALKDELRWLEAGK